MYFVNVQLLYCIQEYPSSLSISVNTFIPFYIGQKVSRCRESCISNFEHYITSKVLTGWEGQTQCPLPTIRNKRMNFDDTKIQLSTFGQKSTCITKMVYFQLEGTKQYVPTFTKPTQYPTIHVPIPKRDDRCTCSKCCFRVWLFARDPYCVLSQIGCTQRAVSC